MESMQLSLENVVNAVFDASNEFAKANAEVELAVCRIFEGFFFLIFHKLLQYLSLLLSLIILVICLEGLLQHLLSIKWTEPALVEVLGHYLDAIGPFLKYFPDAVGSVVNKLFELLTSLPYVIKVPWTIFFSLLILINEKLFRLFC